MSQKFVMLFLVSNPRVVSLDVAAKILIGEDQGADQDKSKFKSESQGAACFLPQGGQISNQLFIAVVFWFSQSAAAVRYRQRAAEPQAHREGPRDRGEGQEAGV